MVVVKDIAISSHSMREGGPRRRRLSPVLRLVADLKLTQAVIFRVAVRRGRLAWTSAI